MQVLDQLRQLQAEDPLLTGPTLPPSSDKAGPRLFTQSASNLLQRSASQSRILSGSPAFDSLIVSRPDDPNVGLSPGQLLEVMGCPGEGKSRVCISYALQVARQVASRDVGPAVLIIDTQGAITPLSLLHAALDACQSNESHAMQILDRIQLWMCTEPDEFIVAIRALPEYAGKTSSLRLVVVDSLSAPLHASYAPSLSISLVQEGIKPKSNGNGPKRRRSANSNDVRLDATYTAIRHVVNSLFKDALMQLSASGVSTIVTTQSRNKMTDEFGEPAAFRDARHSFAVPVLSNHWHMPYTTQILISAGHGGVRNAMVTITPSDKRGQDVAFKTTATGIADP